MADGARGDMSRQSGTFITGRLGASSVLMLAALALAGCDNAVSGDPDRATTRPVKIALVKSASGLTSKTFPGVTEAARKSTLTFRVSGLVQQLPVTAGQKLAKGALIARLDETPYRYVVRDREAKYQLARAQHDRQAILFGKKMIAKSRLDEVEAAMKAAGAALDTARENLKHTSLRAPFAGIIAQVHMDNFQNVQANAPVVEMQGADDINIVFSVPEYILLRAKSKDAPSIPFKVRFNTRAERVFIARYKKHDSIPDTATRSYRVVLEMPMPDDLLVLPGMSVTVEADMTLLEDRPAGNDVLVPVEAVFEQTGKTYVWRVDADSVSRKTAISAIRVEGRFIRVSDGLKTGQQVIAAGVSQITEGLKVRPLTRERGL